MDGWMDLYIHGERGHVAIDECDYFGTVVSLWRLSFPCVISQSQIKRKESGGTEATYISPTLFQ